MVGSRPDRDALLADGAVTLVTLEGTRLAWVVRALAPTTGCERLRAYCERAIDQEGHQQSTRSIARQRCSYIPLLLLLYCGCVATTAYDGAPVLIAMVP